MKKIKGFILTSGIGLIGELEEKELPPVMVKAPRITLINPMLMKHEILGNGGVAVINLPIELMTQSERLENINPDGILCEFEPSDTHISVYEKQVTQIKAAKAGISLVGPDGKLAQ